MTKTMPMRDRIRAHAGMAPDPCTCYCHEHGDACDDCATADEMADVVKALDGLNDFCQEAVRVGVLNAGEMDSNGLMDAADEALFNVAVPSGDEPLRA
jgi:hypothetical protein